MKRLLKVVAAFGLAAAVLTLSTGSAQAHGFGIAGGILGGIAAGTFIGASIAAAHAPIYYSPPAYTVYAPPAYSYFAPGCAVAAPLAYGPPVVYRPYPYVRTYVGPRHYYYYHRRW